MFKPQFKVQIEKQINDYGKFFLEPLEQGYGHTLGNALRRCLLTSMEGAAITSIRMEGVRHQFSTIEGLQEDIVELILNIKKLRIKYRGEKEVILKLDVKGAGEVKASSIKTPAGVEIVNKDLVLANLTDKKAKLSLEMTAGVGYGYSLAEERKVDTLGVIPVDAAFSPVTVVNYKVEATRVGRRTDFDKLILEIWTDGSIKPLEALETASKITESYFKQIYQPTFEKITVEKKEDGDSEVMSLTVEELDLPTRIANALVKGGFKTVKDLVKAPKEKISSVKNLGSKSVSIVTKKLADRGVILEK